MILLRKLVRYSIERERVFMRLKTRVKPCFSNKYRILLENKLSLRQGDIGLGEEEEEEEEETEEEEEEEEAVW